MQRSHVCLQNREGAEQTILLTCCYDFTFSSLHNSFILSAAFLLSIFNDHYFFCEEKAIVKRGKNKKQNQNKPKTTEQTKTGNHNSEKFYLLFIGNRCISVWMLPFIYHPEAKNPKHLCKHR